MTKRTADSQAAAARSSKQARTSDAAAAAASSFSSATAVASVSSAAAATAPSSEAFARRSGLRTLDFVNAMRGSGSVLERIQATCKLLQEDSEREESLLDMSLRVDGDEVSETSESAAWAEQRERWCSLWPVCLSVTSQVGSVCAFFHCIRLFAGTGYSSVDSADTKKLKVEAAIVFVTAIQLVLPRLLRSFDPAITDEATGNNALHELLTRVIPDSTAQWAYKLAEALIQHGVDIHQRNKQGRTVALSLAALVSSWIKSACSLRLLLQHGADINAQDSDGGDSLLHHFIHGNALQVLRDFLEGDASGLDFFVLNSAGQTPVDLAAIMHAQDPDHDNARQIHQVLRAQVEIWRARIRPAVLRCLSEPLIPDVAKLVLGYVDGSGLAFAAAEAPPAAAVAE